MGLPLKEAKPGRNEKPNLIQVNRGCLLEHSLKIGGPASEKRASEGVGGVVQRGEPLLAVPTCLIRVSCSCSNSQPVPC